MDSLSRIAATLWQIVGNLGELAAEIWQLGSGWALVLLWIAWWLGAVNWKKLWPVLGRGAWAPLLLCCVLAALVWSRVAPDSCPCGVPNFWRQLGATGGLVLVAFACGWLQELFYWAPADRRLQTPAHGQE